MLTALSKIRPWGQIDWLWQYLPPVEWMFVGCVGAEDRSIEAWKFFTSKLSTGNSTFLHVEDLPSRYRAEIDTRTSLNISAIKGAASATIEMEKEALFCNSESIVSFADSCIQSSRGHIVLDISSYPKRFFFPILKRLIRSNKVENLIVCYTFPEAHGSVLSENPAPWESLPTFAPVTNVDKGEQQVFLGIGYMPMGFAEILKTDLVGCKIHPLLPVPPFSNRNWHFIKVLESELGTFAQPHRIDSTNVSDVFDYMLVNSDNGDKPGLVAPYGPKPMSLAMALFAITTDSPAYYTQPTVYRPDYSRGVAKREGRPAIAAYAIKSAGRILYATA